MTEKIKATKRLSDFNFEKEGSHVALVGKFQGGPANAVETVVFKSKNTDKISEDQVNKASMVTVTMTITEYLSKFFGLWYEDAEVLAKVMGYDTEVDPVEYNDDWWDNYIQEKVNAVSIMKSLVIDKSDIETAKAVSELSPQDYLQILKSQEVFESNYEKVTSLKKSSAKSEGVTASKGATSPSVEKQEEDSMSEFISKSAMQTAVDEAVQKAVTTVQVELQKAQDKIKQYEQEKAEAVSKARKEAIADVESDTAKVEELFKSLESVNDTAFDAVIKALKSKQEKVEKSDLMNEIGSDGKEINPETKVDRTLEILKSQFKTQEGSK